MQFNGFPSITEYERECARLNYRTKRIPFHWGIEKFFVLVTCPPTRSTPVESWHLFTQDETAEIDDGIISNPSEFMHEAPEYINGKLEAGYMRDGMDVNYVGRLAAAGYFPDDITAADGFLTTNHEAQWRIALEKYAPNTDNTTGHRPERKNTMTNFDFFTGCKTIEDARKRYHQLAQVYHSDKDNGDTETMQMLNDQFAAWIGKDEAARVDVPALPAGVLALPEHLPDGPSAEAAAAAEFMDVISVLVTLPGISCELCGAWVWISGDTKSVKEKLKEAGCKFAAKKAMWYWAPSGSKRRRGRGSKDMSYIRNKYGSRAIYSSSKDD